jgi:hypothetical protein
LNLKRAPTACVAPAVLVAWRSRRSTALRLFAPFIFLLMALVVNLALNANNSLQVNLDRGEGFCAPAAAAASTATAAVAAS